MEVTAVYAAVAFSPLILGLANYYLRWRVVKKAAETGRHVQISGLNPLAPKIDFGERIDSNEDVVVKVEKSLQRVEKSPSSDQLGRPTNARTGNHRSPQIVSDTTEDTSRRHRSRRTENERKRGGNDAMGATSRAARAQEAPATLHLSDKTSRNAAYGGNDTTHQRNEIQQPKQGPEGHDRR